MKTCTLSLFITLLEFLLMDLSAVAQHTWYWHNPIGDGNHLNDISFPSANQGWAVGNGGKLMHYTGSKWSMYDRITFQGLNALWFTDENHGWAVGNNGTVLRYLDGEWIPDFSGTTKKLLDVCFTSPDDGWAVGEIRMHYNGQGWTTLDTIGYGGVSEVCFSDPGHGWCGGFDKFYRYDETGWHWNPLVSSDVIDIRSIYFYDNSHGWVGGVYSDGYYYIMNFNGSSWSWAPSHPPINSNALYFDSPDHGWSCGGQSNWIFTDTTVFEFTNNRWLGSCVSLGTPNAITPGGGNDLFMATEYGHIFRYDSSGWNYSNTQADGRIELTFPNMAHGWMVGDGKFILHYHEGVLAPDTSFGEVRLQRIHFADSSHGIAAGWSKSLQKACIYRYSSSGWQLVTDTISVQIGAVCALANGDAWLASSYVSGGARTYKIDGNNITCYSFPELSEFYSLSFPDPDHGWGIAKKSAGLVYKIIRYQAGSWTEDLTAPSNRVLTAVSFSSPGSGWAVGHSWDNLTGITYHFDGLTWLAGPEAGGRLQDVYHPDPEHTYAISNNTLYTLTGNTWDGEAVVTGQNLVSLSVLPDGTIWLGGSQGGILSTLTPFAVAVEETAGKNPDVGFEITPNPASLYTQLLFTSRGDRHPQEVTVTDLFGRPVRKHRLLHPMTDFRLDLAGLPRGVYLVAVGWENGAVSRKKLVVD